MTAGAERFGSGDLGYRLPVAGSKEAAGLAGAMNAMAAQLHEQIQTIVRQRNEQDAVLQSMAEGVLTVDRDGRILNVNDAGAGMFQLDPAKVRGRFVYEVLRRPALLGFVDRALSTPLPLQEEIAIQDGEPRFLAASGTVLRNERNEPVGVIVVLRDVTQLRRLENVRRDFVANASHELRTPVTAIKGFVETLLEGGLEDKENAHRFLQIIHQNADRLTALIDDILSLARIEKESEERRIVLEPGPLATVLDAAMERCGPLAEQKRMRDRVGVPAGADRPCPCRPARTGGRQPHRQRHQVLQGGQDGPHRGPACNGRNHGCRGRRRVRDRGPAFAAALRAVLRGGPRTEPRSRRHGAWAWRSSSTSPWPTAAGSRCRAT